MNGPSRNTATINFEPAYENGDAFYAALVEAIDVVGDDRALEFLARLTLILSNQIGREDVLREAIELSKADILNR